MDLFLGVDGGQSATKAVVADAAGRVLGRGRSGPCNHVGAAEGRAKLERAVSESIQQALSAAGSPSDDGFRAVCFGMSGGPADKEAVLARLVRTEHFEVTTDAHVALDGALAGEPGAIVIAGTGSIALGRNAQGRTARAGGWGYLFGDEGGAFDLVRQALRAALRMEEGWGPKTALHAVLLEETGAKDVNELMHWFYATDWPRDRIARLLPAVARAADDGDAEAGAIQREGARQLANLLLAVRGRLFPPGELPVSSYVGGVFEIDSVTAAYRESLADLCEVRAPRYSPDLGAVLRAYRMAGLEVELQP